MIRRLEGAFGGVTVARKGVLIDASVLPGFVAMDGGRPVGLLTYDGAHGDCEVVAVISTEEGRGIGRSSMDAARDHAAAAGYHRLWLITTNDNTRAFRFGLPAYLPVEYRSRRRPVRRRASHLRDRRWGCR